MRPVPQTIANDINKTLSDLFLRSPQFLSKESTVFTELSDELDKLGKVDARQRSVLLSGLYALAGDRDKSEYYLDNSRRLHVDRNEIDLANVTMLYALGYFSEALPIVRELVEPQRGLIGAFLSSPAPGAHHLMQDLHEKAKDMNLQNIVPFPEALRSAIEIMDYWGDTDEDYVAALDIAGEILRNHRLFSIGESVVTRAIKRPLDGSPPYNKVVMNLGVDSMKAVELTCEYIDRLADSGIKIPQSMSFEFRSAE